MNIQRLITRTTAKTSKTNLRFGIRHDKKVSIIFHVLDKNVNCDY